MRRRGIALKRKENDGKAMPSHSPSSGASRNLCLKTALTARDEGCTCGLSKRAQTKGERERDRDRDRDRDRERERERLPEQQEQDRAAFLLVSEAWRAELPLGVEAGAWRRHAVSRSAMRMQAVPG